MASARMMRLATEVAPPQFVTAMRQRASKMLDTIHEEADPLATASFSNLALSSKHSTLQTCSSTSPANMPPQYIFKSLKGRISIFGEIKN